MLPTAPAGKPSETFKKTQSVTGKWAITYFLPMRESREG